MLHATDVGLTSDFSGPTRYQQNSRSRTTQLRFKECKVSLIMFQITTILCCGTLIAILGAWELWWARLLGF